MNRSLVLLWLLAAAPVLAQEGEAGMAVIPVIESDGIRYGPGTDGDDRELGDQEYGSALYRTTIGTPDFRPIESSSTWAYDPAGYIYRTGGGTGFWAPVHLPNGAQIENICYWSYDGSAALNVSYDVALYELGSQTGLPGFFSIHTQSTAGLGSANGYHVHCYAVTPYVVSQFGDLNGDGQGGALSFRVVFYLNEANNTQRLGGATLSWRRTVHSAVGGVAYVDVPMGDPLRPYVSALTGAGITAGCQTAPDRFCPDLPVTRGQLAVFLAKALGLYWPY